MKRKTVDDNAADVTEPMRRDGEVDSAEDAAPVDLPPPPWETEPNRFVEAQHCIRLRFVDISLAASDEFAPEFTHQIFEREAIELPLALRPLKMEIVHAATTLDACLHCDRPMTGAVEDAVFSLAAKLPLSCNNTDEVIARASVPFSPGEHCGPLFCEYAIEASDERHHFEVHCGSPDSMPKLASFLVRLQSIMRWYIDGHSPIDMSDNRWRLFSIFERRVADTADAPSTPRYRFVGGATVFHFQRWISKAEAEATGQSSGPSLVLRICQVLILPTYQKKGHGSQLLQALYKYANEKGAELTVEDPNSKFRLLRDLVDMRSCLQRGLLLPQSPSAPATDEQWRQARHELHITTEQLARCYEVQQYAMLEREVAVKREEDPKREEMLKQYRLSVKRRLNKKHLEELSAISSSQDRKARLEALYQELIKEYSSLLPRLQLRTCVQKA
mmetsp:Transcript_30428/g.50371  ORF Transcript_30428/g.50371 Transcript_30428/m.50371 type:complete len:445 (+) Transcript_30428:105-1439(+)|eukprot:CAMPEP_0119330066 /NCGR_PEP_ID=MMETSP1333-20130426/77407_1 /TAXON_ID=418940 /ORGANISM="Scyphosphaera apsteinii, Strain RCC1455" /LENGTH=444 /DNA_ID=CAMNT_0007339351 /DNA_START=103 /DNA_END=1437 /DNA_ORIENTATION=+